jgi:hypothetical protein
LPFCGRADFRPAVLFIFLMEQAMNPTPTVSTPTRRTALRGMCAAAAGIVAAPRLPAVAAAPTPANYDACFEKLTPALARLKAESQAILLPAAWEVTDALAAVLELHYGESGRGECDGAKCEWCADVDGLWYTVDGFINVTWADVGHSLYGNLEAERQRRRGAKGGKIRCGCPLAWAESAIDRLQDDLQKVEEAYDQANGSDTELATDAHYLAWQVGILRCGFDNQSARRMDPAVRQAMRPELLRKAKILNAEMEARKGGVA